MMEGASTQTISGQQVPSELPGPQVPNGLQVLPFAPSGSFVSSGQRVPSGQKVPTQVSQCVSPPNTLHSQNGGIVMMEGASIQVISGQQVPSQLPGPQDPTGLQVLPQAPGSHVPPGLPVSSGQQVPPQVPLGQQVHSGPHFPPGQHFSSGQVPSGQNVQPLTI